MTTRPSEAPPAVDHDNRTASGTSAEATDPYCVPARTAAAMLRPLPWNRLAVLGDSVTAGVMDPLPGYRHRSFADRLTDALAATRPGFAAVNLAEPHLRVAEIRARQLVPALDFAPDAVLVSAGGNDAFRSFDPDALRAELGALLIPLVESGAVVVTVGLFDLARSGLVPREHADGMARRFDTLDAVTADLTRSLGGVHVDTHHHPLGTDPGIYAADRVHGNARGHAVAFAAIAQTLARWSEEDAGA
ncbi:SGNH/GDSL hydrolase family protein [Streptomyces sp. NPDC057854]|uniref:SGNH/GDSL hydrolase family protein n=1 Tax=unclassified Streptomyces TaxID=2593676 RepID=UPI003684DADD